MIPSASQVKEKQKGLLQWIWEPPPPQEGRTRAALKAVLRVLFIVYREFKKDAITLRASALTYAFILSLVPMLALGTAVLKGLGAGDQMKQAAYQMIQKLEVMEESQNPTPPQERPEGGEKAAVPKAPGKGKEEKTPTQPPQERLSTHLKTAVDKVFAYVDQTNFAALGAFGILGLLLTVISVFSKIEDAMNSIWDTARGRPLGRKVMDYLALMILFPIAVNVGLATQAALESPKLLARVHSLIPLPWLWTVIFGLVPLAIIVITFTILYRFLPNTRVEFKSAVVGGIVGGVGWVLVQALYMKLQIGVAKYNAIYGSFATIPLFLLWVYTGWVVFLTGAEFSYATQVWRAYIPHSYRLSPRQALGLAYDSMTALYSAFSQRKAPTIYDVARAVGQTERVLAPVLEALKKEGLVRSLEEGMDQALVPGAPAEEVKAWEVAEAIMGKENLPTRGGLWAEAGFSAMKARLDTVTLRKIVKKEGLEEPESPEEEDHG